VEIKMMNIKKAAIRLGKTEQFIRTGLQNGTLPFGSAEKVDGHFRYSIDETAFNKLIR
jgi:hypothetical protein